MDNVARQYWYLTPDGNKAGYIQSHRLEELWFHTGTNCNIGCSFCLEGAGPGNDRVEPISLEDIKSFVAEAQQLGIKRLAFTGGEPFINDQMVDILDYSLERMPCLVLTNGTKPLRDKIKAVRLLNNKPHPCRFRVSLDYPDPDQHDANRGAGNFMLALDSLSVLHHYGFEVSIARRSKPDENREEVNRAYRPFFEKAGVPPETNIVVFPDLHRPEARVAVPHITENCMTTYQRDETRKLFMCSFSRMVLKKNNRMAVYACTLVDDDPNYDLGHTLEESLKVRISLRHHRCFSCFSLRASCSEP